MSSLQLHVGKLKHRTACEVKSSLSILAAAQCHHIIFFYSDLDEPENPEDIPEYELSMKGALVMRVNYSFLWQHLQPGQLLSILVDKLLMTEVAKKEAESYRQRFAQNSVIIDQLFASDCPPLKLCDSLDVTGQEHIARKLLQGMHCIRCIYQRFTVEPLYCRHPWDQMICEMYLFPGNKYTYLHEVEIQSS